MPDVLGLGSIHCVFTDVLGMIADPLEVTGDEKQLQVIRNAIRPFRHFRREIVGDIVIHLVDLAIALAQRAGENNVAVGIGTNAIAKDCDRINEERTERDRFIEFRLHRKLAGTLRNIDRLIGNPLEITPQLHGRNDLSQIRSDRLKPKQNFDSIIVDFFFEGVDLLLIHDRHGTEVDVAIEQAGRLPVLGEVMADAPVPHTAKGAGPTAHGSIEAGTSADRPQASSALPAVASAQAGPSARTPTMSYWSAAVRVFDLSLSEMLFSRRSVFLALVVGGPVIIALIFRIVELFNMPALRVNGTRVAGGVMFGLMIWVLYIRVIVPILGVFYGTSLIADEVDDKTITYLFTRPIPEEPCWLASTSPTSPARC